MKKKNFLLGIAEIGAGIVLASPADELLLTTGTAGVGGLALPAQLPITAIAGIALVYDGIKRL